MKYSIFVINLEQYQPLDKYRINFFIRINKKIKGKGNNWFLNQDTNK